MSKEGGSIHIPKHLPKRPVYAHNKAWQRIEDSLVELTTERMNAILEESLFTDSDWSAEIVPNATIDYLDEVAIAKARVMFKKARSRILAKRRARGFANVDNFIHMIYFIAGKLHMDYLLDSLKCLDFSPMGVEKNSLQCGENCPAEVVGQ